MTFSDCFPDGFTCNNGDCIELSRKCDSLIDCSDGSDEDDCEFLVASKNYVRDFLPEPLESGDKVQVRRLKPNIYRVVKLNFAQEIEVFCMLFERVPSVNLRHLSKSILNT